MGLTDRSGQVYTIEQNERTRMEEHFISQNNLLNFSESYGFGLWKSKTPFICVHKETDLNGNL